MMNPIFFSYYTVATYDKHSETIFLHAWGCKGVMQLCALKYLSLQSKTPPFRAQQSSN